MSSKLYKAIQRKKRQITKAKNKRKYSKEGKDKDEARKAISKLNKDILLIQQRIAFNNAMRG